MPRVSHAFFFVAVLYAIAGMAWGIHMADSGNHVQFPAHAHLNLLGWVGNAIFGTYFAFHPGRFVKNAWVTFALANIGVLVLIPSLAMLIADGESPTSPYVMPTAIGAGIVFVAMLSFTVAVLRGMFGPQKTNERP